MKMGRASDFGELMGGLGRFGMSVAVSPVFFRFLRRPAGSGWLGRLLPDFPVCRNVISSGWMFHGGFVEQFV